MTKKTIKQQYLAVARYRLNAAVGQLIDRLLCKFGFHKLNYKPIIANLDTYWMQGGIKCARCDFHSISFNEAERLISVSYDRGKERSKTPFLAYGRGVNDVIARYGKEYVQKLVDESANVKLRPTEPPLAKVAPRKE